MKKCTLIALLFIFPLFIFCQGQEKNKIDWISLDKAEEYAKKYDKSVLIFFHKKNCEYCEKMKKETLNNKEVINIINNNFLPVKINGYTKDTIIYNGVTYGNQQPAEHGYGWRHDFFFELIKENKTITAPTIVIMDKNHQKITQFTGHQPRQLLIRNLKKIVK